MLALGNKHIGISIDSTGIRYAKLRKRKGWEIERSGFLPFPDGLIHEDEIVNADSLRIAVQQWAKKEKLRGASATLAVPTGQVIARKMTVPTTNEKELRQIISLEVETTLHLPFEDPVYDYVQTGVDEESTQVLVFAAPRKWIEICVEILKEAHVRVKTVEINAIALARAVYPQREEKLSETLLVYLTDSSMEISMFHEGHPVFVRSMILEEEGYGNQIQHEAQMAGLSAEISRMLNFYQFGIHEGNSRITNAVITGPGERKLKLIQALRDSQPDISIHETAFGEVAASLQDEDYLIAAGLVVRNKNFHSFNLLPRVDREARLLPMLLAAGVVLWVAGVAAVGYSYIDSKNVLESKDTQVAGLQVQLQEKERLIQKSTATDSGSDPKKVVEVLIAQRPDVVYYIRSLEEKFPAGTSVRTISYANSGQITLNVALPDLSAASKYLFDIKRLPFVSSAKLGNVKAQQPSTKMLEDGTIQTIGTSDYVAEYTINTVVAAANPPADSTTDAGSAFSTGDQAGTADANTGKGE